MSALRLPYNLAAERAVLGAAFHHEQTALLVVTSLDESDFFDPAHQIVFACYKHLYRGQEPITLESVSEVLINENRLEAIGGNAGLLALADTFTFAENTDNNIRIIKDKALLRSLILYSQTIVESDYTVETNIGDLLTQLEADFIKITRQRKVGKFTPIREIGQKIRERLHDQHENDGLDTGFTDIEHYLKRLKKGELIIIAARPSVGKTAFALNIASNVARNGHRVALFSIEMKDIKITERILSSISGVQLSTITNPEFLNQAQISKLHSSIEMFDDYDLYIDDSSTITMPELLTKARKLEGVELIIIDYIGLISSHGRVENRQLEVAEYSRALKALARELNIPVIALSQLSRDNEKRKGEKKPALSDIRDSGAIEQDADVVMLLYRADYYKQNEIAAGTEKATNVIEINIAKNRNGSTGIVKLYFDRTLQLFQPYSGE